MKNLQVFLGIRESLRNFLREDIGYGDITAIVLFSQIFPLKLKFSCKSKKAAIVCGLEEAGPYI